MRVRDVIRDLPTSRIAEVSALGFGDPAVIMGWPAPLAAICL